MKCQKCKAEMLIRSGKFGEFYACPKSNPSDNHGTAPVLKGQKAYIENYYSSELSMSGTGNTFSLDKLIQKQMMPFIGRMTDLDLFVEGGYDDAVEDENHWMNTREY